MFLQQPTSKGEATAEPFYMPASAPTFIFMARLFTKNCHKQWREILATCYLWRTGGLDTFCNNYSGVVAFAEPFCVPASVPTFIFITFVAALFTKNATMDSFGFTFVIGRVYKCMPLTVQNSNDDVTRTTSWLKFKGSAVGTDKNR